MNVKNSHNSALKFPYKTSFESYFKIPPAATNPLHECFRFEKKKLRVTESALEGIMIGVRQKDRVTMRT